MPKFIDLTSSVFDHWTVLHRVPNQSNPTKWMCRCQCGVEKAVQAGHLTSGASKSCGCKEMPALKHGHARVKPGQKFSKKYSTWRYIRQRCLDPYGKDAAIYYGLLCERWNEFTFFDLDVPDPPSEALDGQWSIERIENSKGYEPGNVRWATMAEQHRNQSNCRYITFNDKTQILADWAREFGINYDTLYRRVQKHGEELALKMSAVPII